MLSRRSFLQFAGATLAATALHPVSRLAAGFTDGVYQGRALAALPVFGAKSVTHTPLARLWPDSITPILDQTDGWYQIPSGWVQREGLQPMVPYNAAAYQFTSQLPFWAEVAAPVAVVRAYCAADAPLVTRIGHGGVSHVIDALPGEPNGWYGIADEKGQLLGWTQGVFWRPLAPEREKGTGRVLHLDQGQSLLSAFEESQLILQAPFSSGNRLRTGVFQIEDAEIGGGHWQQYYGVSWQTGFSDGHRIAGVYWHNRFGEAVCNGPAVQVTPLLARWMYEWLGDDAHIVVE